MTNSESPTDLSVDVEVLSGLQAMPLHSTDLLTVLDKDGVIRYDSPSIKRIYGYDQDELVGHHVTEYFYPDDHDRVLAAFEALTTASDHHVDIEHTLEPGEISGATFEFSIRQSYLDRLNVAADNVSLYHGVDDE